MFARMAKLMVGRALSDVGLVDVGEVVRARLPVVPPMVLVVERPAGWEPSGQRDLPPNVERVEIGTLGEALAYADSFNAAEMENPSGAWAVVPYSLTSRP